MQKTDLIMNCPAIEPRDIKTFKQDNAGLMKPLFYLIIALLPQFTSVSATDYFPLALGNEWNFRMKINAYETDFTIKVLQESVVASGTMFICTTTYKVATINTEYKESLNYYSSGNDIFSLDSTRQIESRKKLSEHNPQVNSTWDNNNGKGPSIIVFYGPITVSAGTFQSCYAVVETSSNDTTWYAPDVGIAAGTFEGTKYELTSYSVTILGTIPKPDRMKRGNCVNRNIHSIFDPLGRCVERAVDDKSPDVSPGMYIIFRQGNESPAFTTFSFGASE